MWWDPKGREKWEKRKKKGRNREEIPKNFLPQLQAALSHSVAAEATAQSPRSLLSAQAMEALPQQLYIKTSGYPPG
jgi:hypothetical protein